MEFIVDMVHHNPGEAPFQSMFLDPKVLSHYGYNGQVLKNVNFALTFETFDPDVIPEGSEAWIWIKNLQQKLRADFQKAKAEGLAVYSHIDLFVLPRTLVEKYREQLCDEQGRISLDAPLTLPLHKILIDELFATFPELDGLFVRVGETYLFDTPWHVGNGPIRDVQYETSTVPEETEQLRYIKLIRFLRREICVKHNKYLFFRTWDCYPDKLHAQKDYYLMVTDSVETHEKLIFSVKHTALDFWRRVRDNPCIGQGLHRQIIEVQCQREYEGKGAHPNYIMDGVIDGFSELKNPIGLRKAAENPMICGVFTWTRGGGWYGPYIENELWCALHAWVIAQWANHPEETEPALFRQFCMQELNLSKEDADTMRCICTFASEAVLQGRYCAAYDRILNEAIMPTNLWMRDDCLGGLEQLKPVIDHLQKMDLWQEAMEEKIRSCALWANVEEMAKSITTGSEETRAFIQISSRYGRALYEVVRSGWEIVRQYSQNCLSATAFEAYDAAWERFRALREQPLCPTVYEPKYLNLPGTPEVSGLGADLDALRRQLLVET